LKLSDSREAFMAQERFRSAPINYDNLWWLDRIEAANR